jgi:hypothetical protein
LKTKIEQLETLDNKSLIKSPVLLTIHLEFKEDEEIHQALETFKHSVLQYLNKKQQQLLNKIEAL